MAYHAVSRTVYRHPKGYRQCAARRCLLVISANRLKGEQDTDDFSSLESRPKPVKRCIAAYTTDTARRGAARRINRRYGASG